MYIFHILLFSAIVLLSLGVGWAIGQITVQPLVWRLLAAGINLAAIVILPAAWRRASPLWIFALHLTAIVLMSEVLLLLFVAAGALVKFIGNLIYQPLIPVDPARRHLLKCAALYPAAAAAAGIYGGLVGKDALKINYIRVPVGGGAKNLAGFTLAQISDVHLGAFFSLEQLRQLLEKAANLSADALVLTGDIFDDNELNTEAAKIIDSFCPRFPAGIWYIFGNHEYFRDLNAIERALAATSIHVLRNSAARVPAELMRRSPRAVSAIGDGQTKPSLYFVGVDYPRWRGQFAALAADYTEEAFADVPPDAVSILLAHHPLFIDEGAAHGAALVLAGHTHGGQLGAFGRSLVPSTFKYMRGIYQVGKTLGYVHVGNGSWFPFRLGCPPEIAVFTLEPV